MNERLEKECKQLWVKLPTNVLDHPGLYNIAQHFYNLALGDIYKEAQDLKDNHKPVNEPR